MRETACENGHIYDSDMYSSCPYCSGTNRAISFDDNYYNGIGRTTMGSGDIGKTFMDDSNMDEGPGKTVAPKGFLSDEEQEEVGKTVGMDTPKGIAPVAGWLVCVEGPEKGKDYRILCRVNTVGRGKGNDIRIDDPTVSRDRNARISYDPRGNEFHLFPAESSNNIYLNDKAIYVPAELNAYDVIEFGTSKMIFVPFCGEHFNWNRQDNKAE